MPATMFPKTREQEHVLEELCLEHGTCGVTMGGFRAPVGVLMFVSCEDGSFHTVNEDGEVR